MQLIKVLVVFFALVGFLALAVGGYYVYNRVQSGAFKLRNPINIIKPTAKQTTATITSTSPENASIIQDYIKTPVPPPPVVESGVVAAPGAAAPEVVPGRPTPKPIRTPEPSLKIIRNWSTGRKLVALTFDDGPHPEWTPKFIELLVSKKVKATFFLIGPNAEKHPEITKQLSDNGFELANHTMTHPDFKGSKFTPEKIRQELQDTTERIIANGGVSAVTLMRPPYGVAPPKVQQVCEELGLKIIGWNIDTDDWRSSTKEEQMISNVMKNVKDGAIILMHDRSEKAYNTTAKIIDQIRAQGLEFATVSELLGYSGQNRLPAPAVDAVTPESPAADATAPVTQAAPPQSIAPAAVQPSPNTDAVAVQEALPAPAAIKFSISDRKITSPPPVAR